MSPQLDSEAIARLSLITEDVGFAIQHPQTMHRLELLKQWNISEGAKILELGCGQGDCTTALASAVGEHGKVVAVDPADLDYGSPFTLGQAQGHISQGPVGGRIRWVRQAPEDYLATLSASDESTAFDAAVLAHCLWYFASPSLVLSTLRALKQHSKRLLLAEWSLVATKPAAQPHVLAALAQAALQCRMATSTSNIRTLLGPSQLVELAEAAGWKLEKQTRIEPVAGLQDGQWEVYECLSSDFEKEVHDKVTDERERALILAMRDACKASRENAPEGRKKVDCMDVWVSSFI